MKKTILALSAVVALSTGAFAYGGGMMDCQAGGMNQGMGQGMMQGQMGRGMYGGEMRMLQNLNLTDDQRHKLSILQSEMKLEMTKLRDPKMMNKMQDFLTGDSFNKKEYIKLSNEMHEKMSTLRADHMEKVFNLLTKEQRAELKANMAKQPQRPMAPTPSK